MDIAKKHMKHYLGNSGKTMTVDYARLLKDVPDEVNVLNVEVNKAMEFVETNIKNIPISFTSTYTNATGYINDSESWNWYYGVGGYEIWANGEAEFCGEDTYKMKIIVNFDDAYNWNAGQGVVINGVWVPDESNGMLHQAGIAQEYLMAGKVEYEMTWKKGERCTVSKPPAYYKPGR